MQVMSSPVMTTSMKQYQTSINSTCSSQYTDMVGKFTDDFNDKLKLTNTQDEGSLHNQILNANLTQEDEERNERSCYDDDNEDEEEEEGEFSFVCANPSESLISAEDIFQNGQIRPMFPLFNQDLLYADEEAGPMFVEERVEADGPCCVWKGGRSGGAGGGGQGDGDGEASSSEKCKKSNSTGFSKLRRFREFVLRSNSDGKDAFVFFNHNSPTTTATTSSANGNSKRVVNEKTKKDEKKVVVKKKEKGGKKATASSSASAHERHYLRNRAIKGGDKRKSYLPYRQDIVGFFTNVNEFSKNVHPF